MSVQVCQFTISHAVCPLIHIANATCVLCQATGMHVTWPQKCMFQECLCDGVAEKAWEVSDRGSKDLYVD